MDVRKFLLSLISVYIKAGAHALAASRRNWIIFPASAILMILFKVLLGIFAGNSAGGFLMGLVEVAFISFYFSWLRSAERNEKLHLQDLWQFDYGMFSPVINAAFVLYIIRYLAQTLLTPHQLFIFLALELLIFILMNALPEIIYSETPFQMESFGRSFEFVKSNWPEWYLPYIVIFSPIILTRPQEVLFSASLADPILPVQFWAALFAEQSSRILGGFWSLPMSLLFAVVGGNWLMFFRGRLYQELSSGSRRQRMFKV